MTDIYILSSVIIMVLVLEIRRSEIIIKVSLYSSSALGTFRYQNMSEHSSIHDGRLSQPCKSVIYHQEHGIRRVIINIPEV